MESLPAQSRAIATGCHRTPHLQLLSFTLIVRPTLQTRVGLSPPSGTGCEGGSLPTSLLLSRLPAGRHIEGKRWNLSVL